MLILPKNTVKEILLISYYTKDCPIGIQRPTKPVRINEIHLTCLCTA